MTLESQLQASLDLIELRKRDSATLAAVIKAAQAELAARKAQLRKDAAELLQRRKVLQRQAAELSAAGYRVRARVARKDKGTKRGPKQTVIFDVVQSLVRSGLQRMPAIDDVAELNALDQERDAAEYAAALRDEADSDDYERQNAARGNEP